MNIYKVIQHVCTTNCSHLLKSYQKLENNKLKSSNRAVNLTFFFK